MVSTWGTRGTLAAVGVAVAVAGLGGAGIYAATGASSHAEGWHGRPGFDGPGAERPRGEVHAESVVASGEGFRTELTQTGVVATISATSVTARSADGFTKTYVIPPAVKVPGLSSGDDVTIGATVIAGGPPVISAIRRHEDR